MATVREHYGEVLSQYYSRMFGKFEAKVAEQQGLLERLGITARQSGDLAVDLGPLSGTSRTPRLRSSVMKHWPEW